MTVAGQAIEEKNFPLFFNLLNNCPDSPRMVPSRFMVHVMGVRDQFNEALKAAMKAKEAGRVGTLRMILAAVKDRDIAARSENNRDLVSDEDLLTLLAKMVKQREESAEIYDKGGRPELAAQERSEIEIIREFMPKQMSAEEAKAAAAAVIAEIGAASVKDMGKVMGALKARYAGQMDFGKAGGLVKELLSGK